MTTERDPQSRSPNGWSGSPDQSLFILLGELKATSLANREAMLQRTDDMLRFFDQRFTDLKEEVFNRFTRTEAWVKDIDMRLRREEHSTATGPSMLSMALAIARHLPWRRMLRAILVWVLAIVVLLLPAETQSLLKSLGLGLSTSGKR